MPGTNTVPPPLDARTAIHPSGALLIGLYAFAVVGLALAKPLTALIMCALFLWPIASDRLASWFSPHVVYMLYSGTRVIYVGQTDDVLRRMYQHTDGAEHTWWRDINGYNVARHCWSDRQARRIERRMITVINQCAERQWCDKLLNEIWGNTHTKWTVRLTLWWWKTWYLYASWCADCRAFHDPLRDVYTRSIPPRPDRQSADEPHRRRAEQHRFEQAATDAADEVPGGDPFPSRTIVDADVADRDAERNDPDRYAHSAPRRGAGDRYAQDRYATDVTAASPTTTLSTRIRDAHQRRSEAIRATSPTGDADATGERPTEPTQTRQRAKSNAERQRAYRQRQKARNGTADQPSTAGVTDPQNERGRGAGEGS